MLSLSVSCLTIRSESKLQLLVQSAFHVGHAKNLRREFWPAGTQSRQGWHTTSAVQDQKYGQNLLHTKSMVRLLASNSLGSWESLYASSFIVLLYVF